MEKLSNALNSVKNALLAIGKWAVGDIRRFLKISLIFVGIIVISSLPNQLDRLEILPNMPDWIEIIILIVVAVLFF